jgi:hypothetical protein
MWYSRRRRKIKKPEVNIKKGQETGQITANSRQFIPTENDSAIQFAKLFYLSLSGNMNDLYVFTNTKTLLNGKLHCF